MRALPEIVAVEVLGPHALRLTFADGSVGDWAPDESEFFGPFGEPLKDPQMFAQAFIEHGALVWPNGCDASPDAL